MVKWGAIQGFIEESPNDALILLDCCASGTANTSKGSGVTEIITACAWNQTANGVGEYSLTNALVVELQLLSPRARLVWGAVQKCVSPNAKQAADDENGRWSTLGETPCSYSPGLNTRYFET
jgi:hypothetical protein